jgi:two-component system, NtrC family, response regulator AtoC
MSGVLVVDDESSVREILAEFLTLKGYEVKSASNGVEALRLVQEDRPHLILLDVCMPGMNGLEVLQKIREIDQEVGVIMVTGFNEDGMGLEALQLGAFDYITKPLDFEYLERAVWYNVAKMAIRGGNPGGSGAHPGAAVRTR